MDVLSLYLDDIGRFPLLTVEETRTLAKRIWRGKRARNLTAFARARGLNISRRRKTALSRIIAQGEEARQGLINCNLRLVVNIAKNWRGLRAPLEDIIQWGNLGLVAAVDYFDWRRGFRFSTIARRIIEQVVQRQLEDTELAIRIPNYLHERIRWLLAARIILTQELSREPRLEEIAQRMELSLNQAAAIQNAINRNSILSLDKPFAPEDDRSLHDLLPGEDCIDPLEILLDKRAKIAFVQRLLQQAFLTDREREVLTLRFGLGNEKPMTFEEMGRKTRVSRQRAHQAQEKALEKLRIALGVTPL